MPRGKATDAKPRGRMTAYAFFVQTCREEHKKKHPDENVIFAEFSKKCAERWKVSVTQSIYVLCVFIVCFTHTHAIRGCARSPLCVTIAVCVCVSGLIEGGHEDVFYQTKKKRK